MVDQLQNRVLTSSQRLIHAGQKLQPEDPLYNMAFAFSIHGGVDVPSFRQAFSALVARCDALRTVIIENESACTQRVLQFADYELPYLDLSSEPVPEEALEAWLHARARRPFIMDQSLFDSALIRVSEKRFTWYLNQHHLVTDALSMQILYDHQRDYYRLAKEGALASAAALPAFGDYVERLHSAAQPPGTEKARSYWAEQLATPTPATQFYRPRPDRMRGRTQRLRCALGKERTLRLRALAEHADFQALTLDLTLMQLFTTVLFAYLYRLNGNRNLSIGTPSHARRTPAQKMTPGLMIEIFPLQVSIDDEDSFKSLYQKVAAANQRLLINALPGAADFERNRAFDVLLNYVHAHFADFDGNPVETDWIHSGYGDRHHLLRLQVHNFGRSDEITLHFDVNEDQFIDEERRWVIDHFLSLLDHCLADADQAVAAPPLMPADWRPPYQPDPESQQQDSQAQLSVVDGLRRQVAATPGSTALVCRGESLSYADLDARIALTHGLLVERGITPGEVIAVSMRRSIDAVVAIMAVLRSGAVLLPIDPANPDQRIRFILEDAEASLLLTDSENEIDRGVPGLTIGGVSGEAHKRFPEPAALSPDHSRPAYIIYTSGSTGLPKGVAVGHDSLHNYIEWASDYYLQGSPLDFALFSSIGFDLTLTSLFVPLVTGGRLVIYPEPEASSEILIRSIVEDNQVDVIKLTPTHLKLIQSMDFSRSRLKKLIVGGEDFKTDSARAISNQFGGRIDIYNEYGPTEGTVACTVHRFDPVQDLAASVPIGRPIRNAVIHILDGHMNAVPQGVTGEIYIGGIGVAREYLKRPDLTARHFVQLPRSPHQRLYRTGDLARWNAAGQIEYLGRNDAQVKVRGVRVETSEVEAALLRHPGIEDAIIHVAETLHSAPDESGVAHCKRCGLAGNHPSAQLGEDALCRICRHYERYQTQAGSYFRTLDDLAQLIDRIRTDTPGKQDCIMLLSGGKDSSYALCRLVDMGLTPLVFTLDNGFISEGAKDNIKRLVDRLGLELVVGETPAMKEIFVDSLKRHSNVCNGCFKTIYTLSMNLARERGISHICTGLSRGQIFETRVAHLFQQGIYEPAEIDRQIVEARKAYHRTDDVIARTMDVAIFQDDAIFEEIQYLDFYRYTEVTLDEMLHYLSTRAPWIRPRDTGRSTNCLINDAGIFVHKMERGYHNYALPYSWDVRLGHKERNAALDELNDDLDDDKVDRILEQVGYQASSRKLEAQPEHFLTAYYVSRWDVNENEIRDYLRRALPEEFVPRFYVPLDVMPMNENGKIDREALPAPGPTRIETGSEFVPPRSDTESLLLQIWMRMLGVEGIGVEHNFFELGGDSITNIQIVAAARECGISITPQQIFDQPTIRGLADVAGSVEELLTEQGTVIGESALLPGQQRFFATEPRQPDRFSQSVVLQCEGPLNTEILQAAVHCLLEQHDVLRASFRHTASGWRQELADAQARDFKLRLAPLDGSSDEAHRAQFDRELSYLSDQLDLAGGVLVAGSYLSSDDCSNSYLILVINHLVVDGVSWWVLLADLETCYQQLLRGETVKLPAKTTSVQQWANALSIYAETMESRNRHKFWLNNAPTGTDPLSRQLAGSTGKQRSIKTLTTHLSAEDTALLIKEVPGAYNVQVPDVLLTALLRTLLPWLNSADLRVDIEGHGREDPIGGFNLMRTVAWMTSVYPITLGLHGSGDPGQDLKAVKERLRSVPMRGVEYGILRYLAAESRSGQALARETPAGLLFNYMGQWEKNLSEHSGFSFARPVQSCRGEAAPPAHLLEYNALVFAGCLESQWTYSPELLDEKTIGEIASRVNANLRDLIHYCVTTESASFTPSDFPGADLDQQDLDDLLAEFSE